MSGPYLEDVAAGLLDLQPAADAIEARPLEVVVARRLRAIAFNRSQ